MADNFTPTQTQKTTLSGSGCTSTATSIILSSLKLPDGSTTIAMSDLGTIGYGTLEPGTSREEQISFTGITQNADGTATLTGVTRGLRFVDPFDEVSANKRSHAGGTIFILSNTAGFYSKFATKDNDETIAGLWGFTQVPSTAGGNPINPTDLARKAYVDSVVAGIASTVNLIVPGVAGETLTAGNLIYLKAADGRWWLCDADTAATVENVNLGLAQGAGTAGNAITSGVLTQGLDSNQSGLTASTKYYAGNTAGAISTSTGTKEVTVGFSHPTDATKLYFQPRFDQALTEDEQDALVGTSGTPSSTNKFVTDADTTGTGAVARQSVLDALPVNLYGNGTDGAYTLDGTQAAVAGLFSKSGNIYTLLRDGFFTNLTVNVSITLISNNYRILHTGTFTNNGTVHVNGTAGANGAGGTGGVGGTSYTAGSLYGGKSGVHGSNGGNSAVNNGEVSGVSSLGAVGANGGSGGYGSGGTGGTLTAASSTPQTVFNGYLMVDFPAFVGYRTGGGAGGGRSG